MRLVKLIDKISEWTGALSAWIVIPLMLVVIYEVGMRHLFNAPTAWGYDVSWMLFAAPASTQEEDLLKIDLNGFSRFR